MRALAFAAAALAMSLGLAHAAKPQVLDPQASYPEGPLVQGARVFVSEMGADRISVFEGARKRVFWAERGCGPTSIAQYGAGFLVTCHLSAEVVALEGDGRVARRWSKSALAQPLRNPNDSSADDRGGVYFSDPGPFTKDSRPQGAVYRLDAAGTLTRVAEGLWYPNGMFFDAAEQRLYVSEHLGRRLVRYPVDADGALGRLEVFAAIDAIAPPSGSTYPEAGPDGLERAPNGDLVVALYGEGRLLQLSPNGRLRKAHPVPMPYVTNIAFLPDGGAVVTGPKVNDRLPFPGLVLRFAPDAFAR